MQGEYVAVRQVISNKETYKDYLEYFDWFLLKTGDQGVMSNEAKDLLNKYLLNSPSFIIQKRMELIRQKQAYSFKKKIIKYLFIKKRL